MTIDDKTEYFITLAIKYSILISRLRDDKTEYFITFEIKYSILISSLKMTKAAAVIDLDGVVYRGGRNGQYQLIPGAVESLKRLDQADVPYVFVTNGTCCTEAEKARTIIGEENEL